MTTDPIKALVDLEPELQISLKIAEAKNTAAIIPRELRTILAAIEAIKPMADMVMVPREPTEEICNKLRAVLPELFDTSDDTLREIYIDMLAAASPSASTGKDGVVERVARALCLKHGAPPDGDLEHKRGKNWELWTDDARTALAAIGER